ncbi:porin family protein [Polaribacter sp. KT 15]|uniref:porin family protein n=1 Tax=Polaribacter sp. KT 15 TaxID=1896175 RepID=UPI00090995FA|nr:porin family protein [Polaribacter sp. KT 15]SHM70113.1 Outer membrane protein beta-barrel domain-containing protein [Polaribacter sp. KT 15]
MKKVLLAVAILVAGLTANAQEVNFGAKAGVNFANVSGEDVEDNITRTSFNVGAVVEFEITDKFSIQPELIYSAQGAKLEEESDIDLTLKLDYLNVPVIAKFYAAEGFSLEFGPQVGFLLSAKAKAKIGGDSGETDIKDEFETVDFGLNFGAGYKLDSGLNFSARYNLGLSNVAKESESSVKNSVFQISVGYFF